MAKKAKRRRPSQCKKCPGKYKLTYENNAPIYTCDKCGDQDLTWKKFYNEYLQLFRQKDNWDDKKGQVSCIIGFFCHMYEEFYNTPYVFVPRNPNPFGAKECKDTWSLLAAFNGNAHEVRKYVYWLFKKGINKNTIITHFGYINTPGLIRKYNVYAKRKYTLRRESKLPVVFVNWCNEHVPAIFEKYALDTMNDLGALVSYVEYYSDEMGQQSNERRVLEIAEKHNLVKNGKLNIG